MMLLFSKYQRVLLTVLLIGSLVFLLTKCMNHDEPETSTISNVHGQQFAGSPTCIKCHQQISESHLKTAHYLTTRKASREYIKGVFDTGYNSFSYDYDRVVSMETRDKKFYQVEYFKGEEKTSRQIDIVVGSGAMGQSYMTWDKNQLFQLPITYFSAAHQWSNSPGYPNQVIFNRPITSRCLECHSTFAKTISAPGVEPEKFAPAKMIYGVDCEKCHGPAAAHVDYQTKNPAVTTAKFIVNPAHLSRQQNLDLCASCHGGRLQKTRPSFEFSAGDTLSKFFVLDTSAPDPERIDVHGNQYGLMRASKCFKNSETLTCNTCHNSHENERGKMATFSQRCMTCHNTAHNNFCKMAKEIGPAISNNCIDCHMPEKPSRAIAVFLPGGSTPTAALIRSHYISIYPEETKKIIEFIKKK